MSWEDLWSGVHRSGDHMAQKRSLKNIEKEAFRSAYLAAATGLGFFEFDNMDTDGMSDEQKEKMEQAAVTIQRHSFAMACAVSAYITGLTVDISSLSFTAPGSDETVTISNCGALILPQFEHMKEMNTERYQLWTELLGVDFSNSRFQESEWANITPAAHELFEAF